MALLVGLAFLIAVLTQEKILVGGGYGHDGVRYGQWVQDFRRNAIQAGVSSYHIQRVLPSALLYVVGEALHIERTRPNVIRMFEALNIVSVALSALAWSRIARSLQVSAAGRWLGACLLFVSFGIAKWCSFYPVLGDTWALASGFWLLDGYLARRHLLVALIVFAGAFAWPTLLFMGLPLLLFPRTDQADVARAPFRLNTVAAGLIAGLWGWHVIATWLGRFYPGNRYEPISPEFFRLSVVVVVGYLFLGLQRLLNAAQLFSIRSLVKMLLSWRALLTLAAAVLVKVAQSKLASSASPIDTIAGIRIIGYGSIIKPGVFVLAHVLFFGPVFLVLVLRWRDVSAQIQRMGAGLTLAIAMGLLLSVDGESRHLLGFLGLVAPFAIKLLDERRLDGRKIAALCALCLLLSKVWLTLDGSLPGEPSNFPSQGLFMSIGPWISMMMYFVQGVVVAPIALWIAHIVKEPISSGE